MNSDSTYKHVEQEESPILSINMYDTPYINNMALSQVCQLAEQRLSVLKRIQNFFERRKTDEDRDGTFYEALAKEFSTIFITTNIFQMKANDIASHWILKLAFADTLEEDNFFLFYEKILFAARLFSQATKIAKEKLRIADEELEKTLINDQEDLRSEVFFQHLCDYIEVEYSNTNKVKKYQRQKNKATGVLEYVPHDARFILVPFRYCLKAMENYDVELIKGRCQVTPHCSFMVLQDLFEECLKIHRENLIPKINDIYKIDPRIMEVVQSIKAYKDRLDSNVETFYDKKEKFGNITPESISGHLRRHFPVCMGEIHSSFEKVHTLKHMGRLQFGMFLKGLGMDVKDTIRFFKNELNKTSKGQKQEKEYVYYIQHMYGMQGKKTDYTPWSCQKIMGKSPGSNNEVYGCPYVYYSEQELTKLLKTKRNLTSEQVIEVLALKRTDPTLGCRKEFEFNHPGIALRKGIGKHPNSYFSSSYWYHESMGGIKNSEKTN